MINGTCTIEECPKPVRSKNSPYCNMHYFRIYRGGKAGLAAPRKRPAKSPHCEVEGCTKPDLSRGLCAMHEARERRHGDVHKVIASHERDLPTGERHAHWAGDDVSYSAAHSRIRRTRGSADKHQCADCGERAAHWSYDHSDPNERITHAWSVNAVAFSADPAHYDPRCVPCHKRFDMSRRDAFQVA